MHNFKLKMLLLQDMDIFFLYNFPQNIKEYYH